MSFESSSRIERATWYKLFVALHGVSTSHALSRRCQSERSLRSIRDDLLQEESCSDDCGNLLVNMARNSEGSRHQTFRRRSSNHEDSEGEIDGLPSSISDSDHTLRDGSSRVDVRRVTAITRGDRDDDVSSRSEDFRHDSTRSCRPEVERRLSDDHGSTRKDDASDNAVFAMASSENVSDRNAHRTRCVSESVRSTLSLHEPQFGRGTTTSITHSSRHVDEHKRSTRIAKSSTRRPSKDGASRCEHSDDASLLSSLRCADADAIPFLGSTCDASSESDDRSRRHDDERDEHFGADSIGGDVDDAMMNSILPRFSDESHLRGQNRLRLFAKRSTQIATVEDQAFPLHIQNPPVPFLSWSIADELIKIGARHAAWLRRRGDSPRH
jgi:hypothetical protein